MSDNLIALIVCSAVTLYFIIFFIVYFHYENNAEILRKYPQHKDLFKIKSYRKSFLKKYKLLESKKYYVDLIESFNKDIDILDVELNVYERVYRDYRNDGYRKM